MAIASDWHIHTKFSCDSACMEFENLVQEAKRLGITDFGVTDHYHTKLQESDILASRKAYDETLKIHPELSGHFHFGIEATIISKWEADKISRGDYTEPPIFGFRSGGPKNAPVFFDFDKDFLEKYKIEYVIAGMHWPMYCDTDFKSVLKEYHRQYMFAITHPYTDILAHYLWWDSKLFTKIWGLADYKNPFENFSAIPDSMKNEIKFALIENQVALELNGWIFSGKLSPKFTDAYLCWFSELQESGVKIAFGSDCHAPKLSDNCDYRNIDDICKSYGIKTSEFFSL